MLNISLYNLNKYLPLPDWAYAWGGARSQGVIRKTPDDFIVDEIHSFELSGTGEHVYLQIEKCGENTDYIANQLARFAKVRRRDVGYAGLKDRHARTTQWFSVWLPGKSDLDWQQLNSESLKILQAIRHSKKLKRGALAGNRFKLRIQEWSGDKSVIDQQLQIIRQQGVPNYFGEQRFGHDGANIKRALALFAGEKKLSNQRGIYISAARSYLFNHILSIRVFQNTWNQALIGDFLMFDDSRSFFKVDSLDRSILQRIETLDVHPTAVLWGKGNSQSSASVADIEQHVIEQYDEIASSLNSQGVEQGRRPLRCRVRDLQWQFINSKCLELSFVLNSGSYATAMLREIVRVI